MELLFFNTPYLVEITPSTGAISNIGNASGYSSVSPMMDINAASAFDPNQNRLTVFTGAVQLVTIDTGTGAEIAVTSPSVSTVSGLIYEASTALLLAYEFTGTGLVHIDPIAGTVTPVGAPHFGAAPGSGFNIPHALDNQKGLYYIRGLSLPSGGPALLTFDTTSGEVVGDPNVQSQGPFFSQAVLEVDVGSTPLRGTLSLSPRNTATYGSTTTVTFDAPANTGELYIPFVSCTQGSYTVPVSPFTIPLALDACTYFYLLDPAASSIFSLTSAPGQLLDMLSPIGTAQGTVSFPPAAPVGLTLHLSITYLTVSQSFQWTNLHGMGTLHLSL